MGSDDDVTEEELLQMVRDFMESLESSPISPRQSEFLTLKEILSNATDHENEILHKIPLYLSDKQSMINQTKNHLKNKWVAMKLKADGCEASLCKTSWVYPVKLYKDNYEYVDVMMKDKNSNEVTRIIVDMDFKSQFEVARPTSRYKELNELDFARHIRWGEEKLDQVITLVCKAANKSLKKMGLQVPPWRKQTYIHSKWISTDCNKTSISPINVKPSIFSECTNS